MHIKNIFFAITVFILINVMHQEVAAETINENSGQNGNKEWTLPDGYILSVSTRYSTKSEVGDSAEVLLLHQCNRDKTMWEDLEDNLLGQGHNVTKIDYRGYGKSKLANPQYFHTQADRLNLVNDAKSIFLSWIKNQGKKRRIIIGASCGAGLAISLTRSFESISALVLISPALRPQWSGVDGFERFLRDERLPVYVVSAKDDKPETSYVRKLKKHYRGPLHAEILEGDQHGKPLLDEYPNQYSQISQWITDIQ